MKKKKTKLFSWTVASVAALTLLCGTWASAAVSLTSGADAFSVANGKPDGKCSANYAANPICTKRKPEERNNRIHVNSFLVEKNAVPENSARHADGGLRFLNVSNLCLKGGIIKVGIIRIRTGKFVDKFL